MTREEKIQQLEDRGDLDPKCNMCLSIFYPFYNTQWSDTQSCPRTPFAPSHRASKYCQSDKHNHCSCDVCF